MVKEIFLVVISTVLFSCKDSSSKESQDSTKTDKSVDKEISATAGNTRSEQYSFLSEYLDKPLPLIDSTNFNNIKATKELTVQQTELLHLDKILGENYSDVIQSIQISYRLNLSDNFSTIVMSYELGEHELLSTLINYDDDFKPIAWKEIAYDEIAEGLIRKQGNLYKDSIIVGRINYFDEVPDTTFTRFKIGENGSIKNMDE